MLIHIFRPWQKYLQSFEHIHLQLYELLPKGTHYQNYLSLKND